MNRLTTARFAKHCAYMAKEASSWAGEIIDLAEHFNKEADADSVARFISKMRDRLNFLEELSVRAAQSKEQDDG